MTEDRTGRELTPRSDEPQGAVSPREPSVPATTTPAQAEIERFSAGEQTHTVGLTEERSAQIVRQSSNARMVAFLGALILVLFIPFYWLYDIGVPVVGVDGRLNKEADVQYVTDVSRGYALFLANCARCHGQNGQGGVGPPLNDQAKLYNAITEQGLPGTGHLNPDYLAAVLREGGRYVCGDPNSVMPAWLEPKGPLNYREVQEIITFILASKDVDFIYQPTHALAGETLPPPVDVQGWRDPAWTPAPGATPVPACWRAPTTGGTAATPAPVASPGTVDHPRVIDVQGTDRVQWVDPASGQPLTAVSIVQGETVEFHIVNDSPNTAHNFKIGSATELAAAPDPNPLPGVEDFTAANSPQTFTYTFDSVPSPPQFACTVPGHYPTMHVDLVVAGAQPGASPGASPAASPNIVPASPGASFEGPPLPGPGGSPAATP